MEEVREGGLGWWRFPSSPGAQAGLKLSTPLPWFVPTGGKDVAVGQGLEWLHQPGEQDMGGKCGGQGKV